MMKRWGGRLAALLVAAVLPVLLGAAKCEEGQQHPSAPRVPQQPAPPRPAPATGRATVPQQPDPHAGDPQPSGRQERVVQVFTGAWGADYLPVRVQITSLGLQPANISDVITTSGTITFTLTYNPKDEGERHVFATFTPARRGSQKAWCSIEAGPAGNDPTRYSVPDKTHLSCYLTLRR